MREERKEMPREIPDTHRKALAINLDQRRYGTFAEIGAGQEGAARALFEAEGFTVESRTDLEGIVRCLILRADRD